MEDKNENFEVGDIVYLTKAGHDWIARTNPGFSIPLSGRIGKVLKVFNWRTKEGMDLLAQRKSSGKWEEYDPKDFKYVIAIYYPELIMEGHAPGVKAPEVLPLKHPTQDGNPPIFAKWNPDLWKDLITNNQTFSVDVDNSKAPDKPIPTIRAANTKKSNRRLKVVSRSSGTKG